MKEKTHKDFESLSFYSLSTWDHTQENTTCQTKNIKCNKNKENGEELKNNDSSQQDSSEWMSNKLSRKQLVQYI